MNGNQLRDQVPLEDFIQAEDTVAVVVRSDAFPRNKPYMRVSNALLGGYLVIYFSYSNIDKVFADVEPYVVQIFPFVFGLLDEVNLEAAGIMQVQRQPFANLNGRGVLLGCIDTGIDYTIDAFQYEDGTSKIRYIWDQTIKGNAPEDYYYGSEFTNNMINEALNSENPLEIVPHRDIVGHGTYLASIAGS